MSAVRGTWENYSPLISGDRCGWLQLVVAEQSVRLRIAKTSTLACYRVLSADRDGSRYSFTLGELSTIGRSDSLEKLGRLGTLATAKCEEGLANGSQGTARTQMVVDLTGNKLRVLVSPDPGDSLRDLDFEYAPEQCQAS